MIQKSRQRREQQSICLVVFTYRVVGLKSDHSKQPVAYRGVDAADKFVEYMVMEEEEIEQKIKHCEPMFMTGSDWQSFKKATHCHICNKELNPVRVRDHCYVTRKCRGAAHSDFNINYTFTGLSLVIFHNLRGYDSHLIMQAIGKVNKQIKCIPNNLEKHILFSLGSMDFLESFQFMSSWLEKLIEKLAKEGPKTFKHMMTFFDDDKMTLRLRKQVYPYKYFDSESKFTEQELPTIEAFCSSLSEECITDEDYAHAQTAWRSLNYKILVNTTSYTSSLMS